MGPGTRRGIGELLGWVWLSRIEDTAEFEGGDLEQSRSPRSAKVGASRDREPAPGAGLRARSFAGPIAALMPLIVTGPEAR